MSTDAYFATLWDCAPDAMLVFDDRSVIHYVNQQSERLFGYPQTELLRSPLSLLLPSGLSQLPTPGAPLTLSVEARHKAGRRMLVETAITRTDLAAGPLFTASCRKRSGLLQLPAASRAKSEFLGNMSHELRSPLNVIIGFAKLMYRKRVGEVSDAQREYLGDILDSAEHLLELINDLVALAKLEAGKLELQPEPLRLSLLLHELEESLESLARAKNIKLAFASAEPELEVEHDQDRLKQVLLNILSYALRVTPEASSLQLQAQRYDGAHDHVRLEITGESMLAADCMTQLHDGGLRSVLTERLADQLGARIGIACEHSSLYIVLPRCAAGTITPNPDPGST
jgi:PAS domain S-box-containing protein